MAAYVRASDGMDGRRLRKAIISAAASTVETAKDLNKLRPEHVLADFKARRGQRACRGEGGMKVRRDIASIPVRSAGETWQAIVDLITGEGSVDATPLRRPRA